MTPRERVQALIKELDAQRVSLEHLLRLSDVAISLCFHDEAVNPIKSLAARAENMEAAIKGLF